MRLLALRLGLALLACGIGCRQGEEPSGPVASETPEASPSAVPGAGEQPAASARPSPAPATGSVLPIPDLGYNAREGRAAYRHYCATCHGEEGHGDGLNAYNLDPKPRDLADPGFQAKRSDDDLAAVIRSGGGFAGFSTAMPPWGRTLNERKIRNIVEYLHTLTQAPP